MGLLDYADAARKKLAGLLGDMPLVQMAQGRAEMPTMGGLFGALKSMPVFSPDAGQSAYEAALNIGPMGLGKIVYHGSPHKFDKFDASKIGTGEGAQAYGHGIYLADAESVAKDYKNRLGKKADINNIPIASAFPGAPTETVDAIKDYIDKPRSIYEVRNRLEPFLRDNPNDKPLQNAIYYLKRAEEAYGADAKITPGNSGVLYKADLPDEWIPKMLDWDKPISQQPKEVVDGFRQMLKDQKYLGPNDNGPRQLSAALKAWKMERAGMSEKDSGNLFWEAMRDSAGGADKAAEYFRAAGVPGIRYLDGGSRGKGQGSYNYVVFPGLEDQVKILERNGIPLSGLLGGQ